MHGAQVARSVERLAFQAEALERQKRQRGMRMPREDDHQWATRLAVYDMEDMHHTHPGMATLDKAMRREKFKTPSQDDFNFARTYAQTYGVMVPQALKTSRAQEVQQLREDIREAELNAQALKRPSRQAVQDLKVHFEHSQRKTYDNWAGKMRDVNAGLRRMERSVSHLPRTQSLVSPGARLSTNASPASGWQRLFQRRKSPYPSWR